jgi:hypothetical protein
VRSAIIRDFVKLLGSDEITEHNIGSNYSTHGEMWNAYRILVRKPEGTGQHGMANIDGMII